MEVRWPGERMPRRAFLAGGLGGLALALTACTDGDPTPSKLNAPRTNGSLDQRERRNGVGATSDLRAALGEPVAGRLVITGEATSPDAPGTVHGAYAEGLRAAREIAAASEPGDRIAIIGAGIAGLAAARSLVDDGFEVVVVEAGDTVGGRLRTVDDAAFGGPIELGSPFASADAALASAMTDAAVETTPYEPVSQVRDTTGRVVAPSSEGTDAIDGAVAWARERGTDLSLTDALIGSGAIPAPGEPGADGLSPRDWLVHAIATGVEPAAGAVPGRVSAQRFEPGRAWPPDERVTGGWTTLVDLLADGVRIAGSSVVTGISIDDEGVGMRLDTGESLRMHRVVVTASIGVLKTDTITFDPPLPLRHQRAIGVLGMGALDLAWLAFDEPFWRTAGGAHAADGTSGAEPDVFTLVGATPTVAAWLDLGEGPERAVLVGVIAAQHARRIAELDDADALAELLEALAPFATGASATPPSED
ncbi:FAD-dependent oxidoreductase [Agromyces marinus]|uniref:FAD-dependent oxidoreductase n=1 Tax=Agromyces marinus TaxID=1389020 RepID=UPI001F44931E|nr:FAD-dependent oxidoreductase [Agromyces marinus]